MYITSKLIGSTRRHPGLSVLAAVLLALVVVVAFFDWNWLRPSLNSYLSRKTQRSFESSDLHVRLGLTPTIRLRDVVMADAAWGAKTPMAEIGSVEFSVSLRDLFDGKVLLPRVALADAKLRLTRLADDRKNWIFSEPSDTSPSRLRISSLSVTRGQLEYVDHGVPFGLRVAVGTFDPAAQAKGDDADAAPDNSRYTTQYAFEGKYHDAKFSGDALTGDVLSFQESGIDFPLRGHLVAGTTRLDVEGTVADAAKISAIDVRLRMSGQTLANLYPFLLLPLPASPPYRIEGHLTQSGARYGLDEIKGQIGSTDVQGSGAYVNQTPRPLLQARLHSNLLVIKDLGPLVGVTTKSSASTAPPTQAQTGTRPAAKAKEQQQTGGERVLPAGTPPGERLLPTGKFEGGRLKAIDADAELTAKRIQAPDRLNLGNVVVKLRLQNGELKLDPFDLDFAGGRVLAKFALDARQPQLAANAEVQLKDLRLAELVPSSPKLAPSRGSLNGRLAVKGVGNSIADIAAKANGRIGATLSSGQISNLLDAAAGLNGGKVLPLLVGGDKEIAVRCGAAAFEIQQGKGKSELFVVDTDQSRIDGGGEFDLDQERFDLTIAPQPKHPSILSLRSPLRLYGSFRHPDYSIDKKTIAMRAGGAVALGLLEPMAALIPLIETGPGSDVDCKRLNERAVLASTIPPQK